MSNLTTRRAIGVGALSAATGGADPIFAAVTQHALAEDHLEKVLARCERAGFDVGDDTSPPEKRQAWGAVFDACAAVLNTVPTTPAGVAVLLWYVQQSERAGTSFARDDTKETIARKAADAFTAAGLPAFAKVVEERAF